MTLVSLLVGLALAAVLTLAVTTLYAQQRGSAAISAETARLQENARYIDTLLRRELAMTGLLGAGPAPAPAARPVAIDCVAGHWALDTGRMLDLVNDASAPLFSAGGAELTCLGGVDEHRGVLPGSDVLMIKRSAARATLDDGVLADDVRGAEPSQWYLRERDHGLRRDWVYVGAGGRFPGAAMSPGSGVSYFEYYARLFYIRSWAVQRGDGVPSLCLEQLSGNRMVSDCLVEGVEQLQLEFGIDTDDDGVANRILASPDAADLSRAVRVYYHVLLRSLTPVLPLREPRRYRLGARDYLAPADGHLRLLVRGAAPLRNLRLRPQN